MSGRWNRPKEEKMERREFLSAVGGAVVAAGAAVGAVAQSTGMQEMQGADMHAPKYKALEESTSKCVATGEDCLRHCLGMFGMKDTSMAACAHSVTELIAACRALQTLASINSNFTPDFAKATASVCSACETECRKFPNIAVCMACADACKQCAEDCKRLAALFNL
jgi:Cys-rich four helix bundle protein (predicted Tat secretion target)